MGKHSDFKRIKHHQFPGDVPKSWKIILREKRKKPHKLCGLGAKSFLRMLRNRSRAVLKRRARKDMGM